MDDKKSCNKTVNVENNSMEMKILQNQRRIFLQFILFLCKEQIVQNFAYQTSVLFLYNLKRNYLILCFEMLSLQCSLFKVRLICEREIEIESES